MSAPSLFYTLFIFCAGLLELGLAAYAMRRERHAANRSFALFMLALAEWSFCLVFANLAPDPAIQIFWQTAANIGIAFTGPLWLLFALANSGRLAPLPRLLRASIWSTGALSLAALLANDALAIASYGVDAIASAGAPRGPLFWLHALVAYSAILAGLAVVARAAVQARRPYRQQARLLLIGALTPLLVNIAYLARLFGRANNADVTPIALAASGLAFSYAMNRYQMLTLSPIARQVVLDSMVDGLLVIDQAGRVVEHNPAAVRLAQLSSASIGQRLAEASADRAFGQALHDLVAADADTEQIVTSYAPQARHLQVTRTPLTDNAGQRLGTLLMLRDITRQTQAEEALARRAADLTTLHHVASAIGATIEPRELLPAIVTQTRDALGMTYAAIGLLDQASGDLIITAESAADSGFKLAGMRLPLPEHLFDEAAQAKSAIVIPSPQRDPRMASLYGWLARHHIQSMLIIPLRANDRLIGTLNFTSVEAHIFDQEKLDLAQMIAGYVAAAIANAQLFESSQQAVRTKTAILDTISHEFRTPITAILGFTELYQEHVLGPVTEEQQEALSAIHRNSHRLLKLVDDLLDLARLESGRLDLALHPVEVELCIREAVAVVKAQSSGRPFHIQLDLATNLPFARADTIWLRRSLVHLFTHTLSSSPAGCITVRAYEHARPGAAGDHQLLIEIENAELKLSLDEQAAIFEAFERVPHSVSDLAISSIARMGLAISKRAIDQMHGQLSLHSQPDQGSTFTISLHADELALEHAQR